MRAFIDSVPRTGFEPVTLGLEVCGPAKLSLREHHLNWLLVTISGDYSILGQHVTSNPSVLKD